ncbi:hypothetical protein [Natrinema gelatinilyticum]|uniref:hypothetical protein n=1 Tax=Natrinema gelatinilyticum TaxID=2961571 RepID=UPI0020C3FAEB|nr:hypothetical protein [Natrinema gelatinilyticum]
MVGHPTWVLVQDNDYSTANARNGFGRTATQLEPPHGGRSGVTLDTDYHTRVRLEEHLAVVRTTDSHLV